jgi:hypothetical protein
MLKIQDLNREQRATLLLQAQVTAARHFAALVRTGLPENQKYILEWGKVIFPEKFFLPFCHEMHDYFCEQRDAPFTSTEAPRNHAKTTVKCFLIPLLQALEEPWKYQHYLNVQNTEDKALAINTSIMIELEENLTLRAMYGNQVTTEKWTAGQFVLKNGVVFSAIGAGQSIRGINYRQRRPDYILVDDLYNEDDIHNTDATIKKNNWFWGSLYPARAKGKRNAIAIQGTAVNAEDLMEKAKTSKRIVSRTFKAITDWDKKIVLWKELNTFESLMNDREDMGSLIFFREMQNDRLDDSTSKIKRSWLADWEYDPDTLQFDRFRLLISVILGNDPSIGKKHENDFAAFAVILKWRPADGDKTNFYIDFVTQDKLSLDERVKKLQYICSQYTGLRRIRQVRIESISGFQDYTSEVKRRTNLPIKEINWVNDKMVVLENKSKYFEFGRVKLNKSIPQAMKDILIYQLTCNHPNHDDLRDAVFLTLDDSKDWRDWV